MLEYAAAAWAPWLSATSTRKLEKVQLEAVGDITGLVLSTHVEAVLAESQLSLFQRISKLFHSLKMTSALISHLPTIVVKPSSLHADSAGRGKTDATLNLAIIHFITSLSYHHLRLQITGSGRQKS